MKTKPAAASKKRKTAEEEEDVKQQAAVIDFKVQLHCTKAEHPPCCLHVKHTCATQLPHCHALKTCDALYQRLGLPLPGFRTVLH